MNDNTALETANTELQLDTSDNCDCHEQSQEIAMDKLASVSYVAMMSVFSYVLLAVSVHFVA